MANPNTIDWLHYQDIQIDDAEVRKQFRSLMRVGQYADALRLLRENYDNLQGQAYIGSCINKIISGVLVLENYFNDGIILFLEELGKKTEQLVKEFISKGGYDPTKDYVPYNFVEYNNAVYMCYQEAPAGILPTNTDYWVYSNNIGPQGPGVLDWTIRFNWSNTVSYSVNDVVVYDNGLYVALENNLNEAPSTSSKWALVVQNNPAKLYVGVNPPDNPKQNYVWVKTDEDALTTTKDSVNCTFERYNNGAWEEMNPTTLKTLVQGLDDTPSSPSTPNTKITEKVLNFNASSSGQAAMQYIETDANAIQSLIMFNGDSTEFEGDLERLNTAYEGFASLECAWSKEPTTTPTLVLTNPQEESFTIPIILIEYFNEGAI